MYIQANFQKDKNLFHEFHINEILTIIKIITNTLVKEILPCAKEINGNIEFKIFIAYLK